MSKKNKILISAKNIFKTENGEIRKNEFNKHYERYINFCERKI